MSENVKITLNGKEIEVPADATIREAAKSQGIDIPTFCYDDRLKAYTSCFLCVVEVENARNMIPACSTTVTPGMVIRTDTEAIKTTRKMALDLLLSDHSGDCIAPCEDTCPSNIDIQGYIAHISNGNFPAAVKLIKERNPLPVICGRICPHPCESQCRRGLVDEPIAINPLKRFSSEYELEHGPFMPETKPDTGKKVAIVGGGPAGLSAAYYLRQEGHAVDIHEALPELGGMARYGIPRFRLPWDKMDKEISAIIGLGVNVHHNKSLGKDFTIDDLKKNGADAVLIAIGAHRAKKMMVENEDIPGVIGGIDFLRKVVLGEEVNVGKKVAVIGGGDTAMDCCRVAKRAGAEDVTLLYRRSQEEIPALQHEQDETIEEGVEFRLLTAPVEVLEENGKAKGLKVISMELGDPDESGRRRPKPVEGSEEDLEFDLIIAAIGQDPDVSCIEDEKEVPECTRWSTFVYDEKTMITSVEGVFTAGDCAFGPDTVIRAVSEGKQAAKAINLYFSGAKVELKKEYQISAGRLKDLDMADFSPRYVHQKRALETTHPADVRMAAGGYDAINVGIDEAQALAEAARCIECGCKARFDCDLRNYSSEYGIGDVKYKGDRRKYDVDTRHPLVSIEADKCITCACCVRVCSEARKISALSFVNRGFVTKIAPNFDDPLQNTDCDACGMCIDLCPTGTLAENTGKEYGPWVTDISISTCTSCPRGCAIKVHTKEGLITKVQSVDNDPINGAMICREGRFSNHLQDKAIELTDNELKEQLNNARNLLDDASKLAVIVSPKLTVETLFAAKSLCEEKNGTLYYIPGEKSEPNKFPFAKLKNSSNTALLNKMGAKAWDNASTDCILLVGAYLENKPKESVKVITMSNFKNGIAPDAQIPLADPLKSEGAVLTDEGYLAFLNTKLPVGKDLTPYTLLANLGGLNGFEDIASIRKQLAASVTELNGLLESGSDRLVKTNLTPEMIDVAPDCREVAFAKYCEGLGL
ncbi:molybdopterin oxidoreductase,molybdopterin-containing subunit/ NuoG subunit of NADHdehydrogenase I [Candidatus Scalindua japonica]|uniref:Molybdopterin oxidoreductase,molybdopterin-containing subunit/ NuoG subunit of NADHdehydrogenase I n=1 Tax=Candidatus Scalindua japonica TaxID=1284222 RepID=A0A286TWB2_9BACT|nr:FAD-dependent oxidoreductase [Candidatus Scalindua japonica]GAX60179.1 molybdopterin oxidoreductase,molybdopterin-containing subunit/ NuoG subunit of NADHdehydrogenase I [Candidatus Scalindua japonica]